MICNISSITGLLHRHYDGYHHHHQHLCHLSWQLPVNIIPRTTIGLGFNKKKLLVFFFFEPLSCKCRFRRHRKHIRYWAWQSRWSKYLFWKGDNHDHNVRWCLTISWIREKGNRVVVRILKLKLKFFTMLLFCSLINDIWMWRIDVWRG